MSSAEPGTGQPPERECRPDEPTVREHLLAIQAGRATPPGAALLLGVRIIDVSPGRAVFGLPYRPEHDNGGGFVHGGLIAALADFALGCAVNDVPAGTGVATAGLAITYTRPVTAAAGEIRAAAEVVHRGGRTAVVQARVTDPSGVLHALATATCVIGARGTELLAQE